MKITFTRVLLFLIFTFLLSDIALAQKVLTYRITNRAMSGPDCDGTFGGNSDYYMSFGDVTGSLDDDCYGRDDVNSWSQAINHALYQNTIICRSDWPGGNLNYDVRSVETDGGSACGLLDYINTAAIANNYRYTLSRAYPTLAGTSNATNGNYDAHTFSNTWSDCGTVTNTINARWEITGSWQTSKNQDGSGYITNTSCTTSPTLSPGLPTGWTTLVNQHIKRCGDIYYKFNLTANVSYFEIDMFNDDGDVDVYYADAAGNCICSVPNDAGLLDYDFKANNPRQGWYVVRLRNGGNYANIDFRTGGTVSKPANDDICNATNLSSAFNYNSGNLNPSGNTDNASNEDYCGMNEPDNPGENSIWYKFTVGANPPAKINVNPTAGDWDEYGVAILYKANASSFTCATYPSSTLFDPSRLPKVGESTLGVSFDVNCLEAGATYYLQLRTRKAALPYPSAPAGGPISATISSNQAAVPQNDLPCNATDLGASAMGTTIQSGVSRVHNNFCSGSSGEAGWSTGFGKEQTVWYKFTTGASVGDEIEVSVRNDPGSYGDQISSEVTVFKRATCSSGAITVVGEENPIPVFGNSSSVKFCPDPNSQYWIVIDHDPAITAAGEGFFDVRVIQSNNQKGPDLICNALDLGALSSAVNTNLQALNQSNRCAGVGSGEPNQYSVQSIDKTVWYKFTTPPADYSDGTLYHLYDINVNRKSGSSTLAWPTFQLFRQTANSVRSCTESAAGSFQNLQAIDYTQNLDFGDAQLQYLCLVANSTYFIQVDYASADPTELITPDDYVVFDLIVKKSAFRPADEACDALDLFPGSTIPKNKTYTKANSPLNAAPYFGLPHSNRCKSAIQGTEPNVTVGAPGGAVSNYSATGWYKFTTDANPPEWIEWDHIDYALDGATRIKLAAPLGFESRLYMYESYGNCASYNQFAVQSERDLSGDFVPATLDPSKFRLTCPKPNTTYYVQFQDAGVLSLFYEGVVEPTIKTPNTSPTYPTNDEPCGAIFLGTVPNGGQLAPSTVYNNFCATPTVGFVADQTQPLERDVWFSFIAPTSGSVLITAQSGVSSGADNDLDMQVAIWDPIMGQGNQNPNCADPRYLWSPIISRDHDILDYGDVPVISTTYYDILDTKNNLFNEGNSLIATCLKPGKMYYVQVDGGDYLLCDLFDGGNCIQGNFRLQVKDAGLYDMASMQTAPQGNDEPCGAKTLTPTAAAAPLSWLNGSNLCATAINDPVPSKWKSCDATVWYKFVAPPEGKVRIRTEGVSQLVRRNKVDPNNTGSGTGLTTSDADYHEDINLQFAVYEMGPDCRNKPSLTEIYSTYDGVLTENNFGNDDDYVSVGTDGFDEYGVVRCLVPGRTYYIMVDGENDPTLGLPLFESNIEDVVGDFRISVQRFNTTLASTNDNICNAFEITGTATMALSSAITRGPFNNECATIEGFEAPGQVADEMEGTLFDCSAKRTLWYKFKAPSSGKVKIEAINTDNDPIDLAVALYDLPNENCVNAAAAYKVDDDYDPAASPVAIDFANLRNEEITITCLEPGRYYYLQVDGANNPVMCTLSGGDCERGEFNIRITHEPSDPTVDRVGQGNDDFCDAIDFGALNPGNNKFRNDDNNRCSTTEINEPNTNGWDFSVFDDQDRTVWYRFKTGAALGPLAPGEITITVNDPSNDPCFDLDVDLYEYQGNFTTAACATQEVYNTQFNKLFRVGEGDPIGLIPLTDDNRSERIILDCPKPNTTYFVRVNGTTTCPLFGDDQGSFDVRVEMDGVSLAVRENDDICGATSPTGDFGGLLSGTTKQKLNQNNFCATQELGEPNTTQSAVQNEPEYDETMWYHFRTSATPGNIRVRLEAVLPVGFATVPSLTVYKENIFNYNPCTMGFGQLIEVGSDAGSATALGGITDFDAVVELPCPSPDADYYIQVDGYDLSLFGFTIPGYSDNFTYNLYITDDGNGTGRPINDSLVDAIPVDSIAPINGQLTAGGYLAIKGHNRCAKAEDNEPRYSDIASSTVNGSNTTDHDNGLEDETVWYYFITPSKPGVINVRVEDDPGSPESFCPNFAIFYNDGTNPTYRITAAPSAQLIQEGTESSAITGTSTNKNYTCLLPNTKYYIQIDGNDLVPLRTDQGAFIVTVTDDGSGNPGPSNDLICQASTITLNQNASVVTNGTNKCSWEEVDEPNTSGNIGGSGDDVTSDAYDETVWYKFQPSWEGQVRIQLSSAEGHNFILYRSSLGTYNCATPNWSALTRMSTSSGSNDLTFRCLDNGVWYFIQIDGNDGIGDDVGPFTLTITHSDETILNNDMFCSATNMGTFAASNTFTAANQNNICATQELNEPNVNGDYYNINSIGYDKTLWYRFTTSAVRGDYNISVTNNSPYTDRVSAGITVYELSGTACSGVTPNWGNLVQVEQDILPFSGGLTDGDNNIAFDCWELKTGTTYYVQVDGIDINEVGTNFNVAVQYTSEPAVLNDNVCTPTTIIVGAAAITDNNLCATTQTGELNISPSPQSSYDAGYDETMWYRFQAPTEGFVRIVGTSLASDNIDLNMGLYEINSGTNISCPAGLPQWGGLTQVATVDNLISNNFDYENQCLVPGKWYLIQIDGNDLLPNLDKGNYTLQVINQHTALGVPGPPANDEPCAGALPAAVDISGTIQEAPCNNGNPYYSDTLSIFNNGSNDVDRATSSNLGQSCGSRVNCSDYWYKFTVPMDSDGGIKIQGEDDYGLAGTASSTLVVAAYRVIGNPCGGGSLQFVKCDYGGNGRDVEFDFGASPGEQIYLQVFNDQTPEATRPQFGLCVSTRCPPKSTCTIANNIPYGTAACWNLDEDGNNINDNNPLYSDCLPGDNLSANYFTFSTSCGPTANGYPDTVTIVFSALDISSNTAMAIFEDSSPCDGNAQSTLVNCVPFGGCTGCSPTSNFVQTFLLPECKTYVIQVLGEDDDDDGSAGQVYIFQSTLEPPILPVTLLTFTGYHDGQYNILDWTTASEINSSHFEVEKSTDGVNFSYIGRVAASGNSTEPTDYGFVDKNPVKGVNYYRLKTVDQDMSFEYSKVITITVGDNTVVKTGIANVYPNPTSGKINVVITVAEENAKVNWQVTNMIGQQMYSEVKSLSKGQHIIELDASDFAQGVYIIHFTNIQNGSSFEAKFVKQ